MPTLNAVDYSFARPDPAALKAAGIKVVCRYLTGAGKAVTRPEIDALHAQGIGVLLNFEADAGDALGGAAKGAANRVLAVAAADALGAPALPIVYSVDRDIASEQMSTVMAYLHAADHPQHQSRAYGEYAVIEAFGRWGWQTIAWSNGQLSQHAAIYQYAINQTLGGAAVDYDEVLNLAQLGAWMPPAAPQPVPIEEDPLLAFVYTASGAMWVTDPLYKSARGYTDSASYASWLTQFKAAGGQVRTTTVTAKQHAEIIGRPIA